jgi:hypothetical protein
LADSSNGGTVTKILIFTDIHPYPGFPPCCKRRQKRLDIFFGGMLIKVALNEYSFSITGGGAESIKELGKTQGKTTALPLHGE